MSLERLIGVDINGVDRKTEVIFSTPDFQFMKILEIGEFDNGRVDRILEKYNLKDLLRFPSILIECFLNRKITENQLRKYSCIIKRPVESIECLSTRLRKGDKLYKGELHLSADKNIVLYYEDIAIANIGLRENVVSEIQSLSLYSLHESIGKSRLHNYDKVFSLEGFNWKKVLIKLAEQYLKDNGETQITVRGAVANRWPTVKSTCLPDQWGYSIYDEPCLELGYDTNFKEIPGHGKIALLHTKNIS